MAIEKLTKRTIYVANCPKCGESDVKDDNPPRERYCNNCQEWAKYEEQSYIGKDRFDK